MIQSYLYPLASPSPSLPLISYPLASLSPRIENTITPQAFGLTPHSV